MTDIQTLYQDLQVLDKQRSIALQESNADKLRQIQDKILEVEKKIDIILNHNY